MVLVVDPAGFRVVDSISTSSSEPAVVVVSTGPWVAVVEAWVVFLVKTRRGSVSGMVVFSAGTVVVSGAPYPEAGAIVVSGVPYPAGAVVVSGIP